MSGRRYDLEDRLINFAVQICLLTDRFPPTPVAKHVSTQITRSGTSPFANYGEAQAIELQLRSQESAFSLLMADSRQRRSNPDNIGAARQECDELVSILVASVRTARGKVKMSNIQ